MVTFSPAICHVHCFKTETSIRACMVSSTSEVMTALLMTMSANQRGYGFPQICVPVLPAPGRRLSETPDPRAPKQSSRGKVRVNMTLLACERCRKSKSKVRAHPMTVRRGLEHTVVTIYGQCSGDRPSCQSCTKARKSCVYNGSPNETRSAALKRKYVALEKDNSDLQELLHCLQCRSESEAIAILGRLRSRYGPSSVLQQVKDSDVLLQAFRGPLSDKSDNNDNHNTDIYLSNSYAADTSSHTVGRTNARSLGLGDRKPEGNSFPAISSSSQVQDLTVRANKASPVLGTRGFHGAKGPSHHLSSFVRERGFSSVQNREGALEELYYHMQTLPEAQMLGALRHIRSGGDPFSVLDFIYHAIFKASKHWQLQAAKMTTSDFVCSMRQPFARATSRCLHDRGQL